MTSKRIAKIAALRIKKAPVFADREVAASALSDRKKPARKPCRKTAVRKTARKSATRKTGRR